MAKRKGIAYTTHEEDKHLAVEAVNGDRRAYNILLTKYKPILYTAAKRRLPWKDPEDLEDITMIVLGNAFLKLNQYNPEKSKLFTWMVACLHNYVNSIPKQKKRVQTYSIEDSPREVSEKPEAHNFDTDIDRERVSLLVKTLISKLPIDISKAITMKYFKDASHAEIAEAIGCKPEEVWYKLKRGKDLLKRMSETSELFG
jgi:RNA polymerase sigma-70 factor (ECF subfamily)